MSEDVAAGEPSQAPTPKRSWGVWRVWFGVALLLWAVSFAEEYLVFPPSSAPLPLGFTVALATWFFVLNMVLVPFAGYFVQQRLKSFDLTGIFVMTLAAGFLVGMVPMTITQGCVPIIGSGKCSYQLDLSMPFIQSELQNNTGTALGNALNFSLTMLAGAFLSQWRRGAISITSPGRRKDSLLAAWLVIGFVAVGAASVATDYLFYPPGNFSPEYISLVQILSGPVLAFCLGNLLYGRLHEVGIKRLFSMVALGGILASAITQAARGILLAQMASSVISSILLGTFATWIVLSGCLLSAFENQRARSKEIGVASVVPGDQPKPLAVPILALGSAVAVGSYVAGIYFQAALFGESPSMSRVANLGASFGLYLGLFLVLAGLVVLYWERQDLQALE